MTELLYLKDSYAREFKAQVLHANGREIVVDRTCFYPAGGGQPSDAGRFVMNEEFKVLSARKSDQGIVHELDKDGLKPGDKVSGFIDWDRRYKLMRSHTAIHVLVSVICKHTGALITGNQIDLDKSRIDFNLEQFDKETIRKYIQEANDLISNDLPITIEFATREKALQDPSLFKLMKGFPENIKDIRIVTIDSIDKQADGGTHVKSTKEIGKIELIECENKGKNNRRIYIKLA